MTANNENKNVFSASFILHIAPNEFPTIHPGLRMVALILRFCELRETSRHTSFHPSTVIGGHTFSSFKYKPSSLN